MSGSLVLLVGLLVLSYLGSSLGPRLHRSEWGTWYVAIGAGLGPLGLGLIAHEWVVQFEALTMVGAGWLALVNGLPLSAPRGWKSVGLDVALASGVGVLVAVGSWRLLGHDAERQTRIVASLGASALAISVCIRTPAGRTIAAAMLGGLCVWAPGHGLVAYSDAVRVGVTLVTGAALGTVVALVSGKRDDDYWAVLLGAALLGIGVTLRLGLSVIATAALMAAILRLMANRIGELHGAVAATHASVQLPVALLLGATVLPKVLSTHGLWLLGLGAAVGALIVAAQIGRRFGVQFWPNAGALDVQPLYSFPMAVCLELSVRFPEHEVGRVLLTLGVLLMLLRASIDSLVGWAEQRGVKGEV